MNDFKMAPVQLLGTHFEFLEILDPRNKNVQIEKVFEALMNQIHTPDVPKHLLPNKMENNLEAGVPVYLEAGVPYRLDAGVCLSVCLEAGVLDHLQK